MSKNKKFGLAGVMSWPVGFVASTAENVLLAGTNGSPTDWTNLSCQSIKQVGKRHLGAALYHELTSAKNVHQFNACQGALR